MFKRKEQRAAPAPAPTFDGPVASGPTPVAVQAHTTDNAAPWASIDAIRREWPQSALDPSGDLRAWEQGLSLYNNDDYLSMMRCAAIFGKSLAHGLYGEGILHGSDLPNTIFKALFASTSAPPDGRTFADEAQKTARLALTLVRENGWQPKHMGGQGLFDELIMDKGNYLLLGSAIGPDNRPWEGDLKAFFSVPPSPIVLDVPHPDTDRAAVHRLHETMQKAEAGDVVSELHFRGMGLWANGDLDGAMASLTEAAKAGSAQAMKDAGDLALDRGRDSEAQFWFNAGAQAGHGACMYNMAVLALQQQDLAAAAAWYERAAEAGEPDGYAALTQMADERGDEAAEKHWARLGAEAGQTFCLHRHGFFLIVEAQGEPAVLRRGRAFVQLAADRGDADAALLVCKVSRQLGDHGVITEYAAKARATGDPDVLQAFADAGF